MWLSSRLYFLAVATLITNQSFAEFDPALPFLSKTKYDQAKLAGFGTWIRDGAEMEMTFKFTCNDKDQDSLAMDKAIYKILTANNYEKFKKMVKCKDCSAISQGFGSPELMSWDKISHAVRQNLGYMPVTIEYERLQPQELPSSLKLSYGSDLMDDIYYDTDEFLAISNYYGLRARKRWDSANSTAKPMMRRILVGLKETPPIDPKGLKTAMKIDDRFDSPTIEQILNFSSEIPTGIRDQSGTKYPIPSVMRLYEGLAAKGLLQDQGSEVGVLQLKPKTFLRSLRLRYHYGSFSSQTTISGLKFSKEVLNEVSDLAKKLDLTSLTEIEKKSVAKIISIADAINDPTGYLAIKGLDKTDNLVEENIKAKGYFDLYQIGSLPFDKIQRAVKISEALAAIYREVGYEIEHNAHLFAKQPKTSKETAGIKKVIFVVANEKTGGLGGVILPEAARYFEKNLAGLITENGIAKTIEILNAKVEVLKASGSAVYADLTPFTEKQVEDALEIFTFKKFEEAGRQVEMGSALHKQLAFMVLNVAVVGRYQPSENMFIDTVDFVGMFKAVPLEVDEYDSANPGNPPVRKVLDFNLLTNNHVITGKSIDENLIGAYLSNDVQLELGEEKPFLNAIVKHAADPVKKAGAEWILEQITRFQKTAARLKVLSINSYIDKKDVTKAGCTKFAWKPTDMPKGEASLKKLKDMEASQNAPQ